MKTAIKFLIFPLIGLIILLKHGQEDYINVCKSCKINTLTPNGKMIHFVTYGDDMVMSDLNANNGKFEDLIDWFDSNLFDSIVDIGCNVGSLSLYTAKTVPTICVEMQPKLAIALSFAKILNHIPNLMIINKAISRSKGKVSFN